MRALVFSLLLVAGCSYAAPPDSALCPSGFTADEEVEIASAAGEWNGRAGTSLSIVSADSAGCVPVLYAGERDGGEMGRTHLGLNEKIHLWVYPDPMHNLRLDVLHEIGHLLSGDPDHSDDPADVMFWQPTAEHLTAHDIERAQ